MSHEDSASKQCGNATEPDAEVETKFKSPTGQAQATCAEEGGGLTVTLPAMHSNISELAFPVRFCSQPLQNGDSATQKQAASNTNPAPVPTPRQKQTKPPRGPPSQHIAEVSDEGSNGASSLSRHNISANVAANPTPTRPHPTQCSPPPAQLLGRRTPAPKTSTPLARSKLWKTIRLR